MSTQPKLTPYDTGSRLEARSWIPYGTNVSEVTPAENFGKVDFDDDEGGTVAVIYMERSADGKFVVHIQPLSDVEDIVIQVHQP